jgi:hypothetical protein
MEQGRASNPWQLAMERLIGNALKRAELGWMQLKKDVCEHVFYILGLKKFDN